MEAEAITGLATVRGSPLSRERLAMLGGLLEDAAVRYGRGEAEAIAWAESEDDADVFSFVSICDALGYAPGYIRRLLRTCPLPHRARTRGGYLRGEFGVRKR